MEYKVFPKRAKKERPMWGNLGRPPRGGGEGMLDLPDAEGVAGDLVPIPLPIWAS